MCSHTEITTTCTSWFSHTTWIPGIEIRSPVLRSKSFYPSGHLTGPRYNIFIRQNKQKRRINLQVARSQKQRKNRKADLFFQMNIWTYDIKQQCVNCCIRSNKSHAVLEDHTCYIVILFSSEKRSSKSSSGPLKARQLRDTILKFGLQMLCTC